MGSYHELWLLWFLSDIKRNALKTQGAVFVWLQVLVRNKTPLEYMLALYRSTNSKLHLYGVM